MRWIAAYGIIAAILTVAVGDSMAHPVAYGLVLAAIAVVPTFVVCACAHGLTGALSGGGGQDAKTGGGAGAALLDALAIAGTALAAFVAALVGLAKKA